MNLYLCAWGTVYLLNQNYVLVRRKEIDDLNMREGAVIVCINVAADIK